MLVLSPSRLYRLWMDMVKRDSSAVADSRGGVQTEGAVEVRADIPGVSKDDINVRPPPPCMHAGTPARQML